MPSVAEETKALMKSPGGWFFVSNAILYTQTHVTVALAFLAALFLQRLYAFRATKNAPTCRLASLLAGHQGLLAVNAIMTLASACLTLRAGNLILGVSGLGFGVANLIQANIYSGLLTKLLAPHNLTKRHLTLAGCEFLIALALALIAINAGYAPPIAFSLVLPVIAAGIVRSFRSHWLPPGLAYADMMILSVMTGCVAVSTGNMANAVSRVLVLFGLTRLAVLRARHDGKTSIFDVESFFARKNNPPEQP